MEAQRRHQAQKTPPSKSKTLYLLGVPLDGQPAFLSAPAKHILEISDIVVAESPTRAHALLKGVSLKHHHLFFLHRGFEKMRQSFFEAVQEKGQNSARDPITIVLFSDTGMPLLFDPGREILTWCQTQGFEIRTVPGPTSWGTACAASGWLPPFFVLGFLPRTNPERRHLLKESLNARGHLVLMDTPHRFHRLAEEVNEVLVSMPRTVFCALDLGSPQEILWWGPSSRLLEFTSTQAPKKPEFVLLIQSRP